MGDIVQRLRDFADPSKWPHARDTDDMALEAAGEIERLAAECIARQQAQIASGHSLQKAYNELAEHLYQRRCWECKHVGYYALDILPFCQCSECGSADTRRLTAADAAGGE